MRFFHDEEGQAVTEYVLLLAVLATIILVAGMSFRSLMVKLVKGKIGNNMLNKFFSPQSLHRFPLAIPK